MIEPPATEQLPPLYEGQGLPVDKLDLGKFEDFVFTCLLQVAATCAYSGDGDRRFRFIVTGLARSEVLDVDDNSVGHDGCLVGTGFGLFGGPT
jgi:hypothetical protein